MALTICLHRSGKGGRKNGLLFSGVSLRPPFPPGEAGRSAVLGKGRTILLNKYHNLTSEH